MIDKLYFSSISFNTYQDPVWQRIYDSCGYDGKFFINISKRINPCRFVTRNGKWSLPWQQDLIPGFEMPAYDPTFSTSFAEVSDNKALSIQRRIHNGEKFAVMYSGGIDSTVIMTALIKNLSVEDLKSVAVCASIESIMENPVFWNKFINNKLSVIDSNTHKYDDLIEAGYVPITADEGDCMFGTLFGLTLYNNFDYYAQRLSGDARTELNNIKHRISDADVHYSRYADLIISHLGIPSDPNFGKLLYEKYVHNINTATVPINSLHDFFWWLIFNVKYLNCSVRGALYYNDRIEWKQAINTVINWFNDPDYQRWSMANNNNGQKIISTVSSYKQVAKNYIWELDRNDWYRDFKIKLESLGYVVSKQSVSSMATNLRPMARVGLTTDYQMLYIDDPAVQEFYKQHLQNYKIDWT
jgi:hypothetical protein